jgi:probable phosphoglycerate mutase
MLDKLEFDLYLIRHGESAVNAIPDLMGQSADVPLTDKGRNQALLLSKLWEKTGTVFDGIFSSPYVRSLDTAKIATKNILEFSEKINEPVEIVEIDALREYDAGDWLGLSRKETLTKDVKYKMNALNHVFLPPKGESQSMVERRASEWLEETFIHNPFVYGWYERKKSPLQLALFSHGMTIKCLLHYILGFDKSLTWKISIDNTSVSKLSFDDEGWHLRTINDCTHLFLE